MSLDDLYDLANRKGHDIVYINLPEIQSISVSNNGKCVIGMDTSLHGIDELEHAAHELGHCETGSFYDLASDPIAVMRCEFKANKWAYQHLAPWEDLLTAFRSGCASVWDLAEYFNLHPKTIERILAIYFGE